ncbi:MAG: NAD-dependent epimerase/dehydratase family protein [Candidatus Omnitrophota bacterium]
MKFKEVLITGGAGFIGSHLCHRLLKAKIIPVVLDNLSVGKKENVPSGCKFIKGDIQDFKLAQQVIKNVDAVFHLAANVTIRGSVDKFHEDAYTNIMGTLNLLRACRVSKRVKKFIFASSMAVYADCTRPKSINEDYKKEPISPYGIAKLAGEKYVLVACAQIGIESTVLRYFNTYGPGQTFTPYVGVITIFINRLLDNKSPVIFGDGKQRRDFVYVGDIVEATYRVLNKKTDRKIFNVGTGIDTSVNQIAKILINKINPKLKPSYTKAVAGELRNSIVDNQRLEKAIKFKPQQKLEKKIDEVIDYIKKQRDKTQ